MRFSAGYLGLALLLLIVEIYIAVAVHDRFVRPHLGDALVVVLLYCLVAAFFDWPRRWIALGVFLFACAVEVGQALHLADRLHLSHNRVLRVMIGTDFDPGDLLAYLGGAVAVLVGERLRRR